MTQYDSIIFKPLPRHIPTCSHFIKTRALGFGSEAHLKLVDSSAESSTPGCRLRTSTQRRRSKEMPSSLILPCKAESFLWCFWKSMEDQVMSTCEWQYQACICPKLNCLLSLSLLICGLSSHNGISVFLFTKILVNHRRHSIHAHSVNVKLIDPVMGCTWSSVFHFTWSNLESHKDTQRLYTRSTTLNSGQSLKARHQANMLELPLLRSCSELFPNQEFLPDCLRTRTVAHHSTPPSPIRPLRNERRQSPWRRQCHCCALTWHGSVDASAVPHVCHQFVFVQDSMEWAQVNMSEHVRHAFIIFLSFYFIYNF